MEIQEAERGDIPDIVNLLKQSLGESLIPKSEQYWRWKHIENPFGPSPVLLYRQGSELIGVRAFMRWEWSRNQNVYRAVRAVDTATHPAHQGKGIFKKMTLAGVDRCTKKGDHFVYNTPNMQSMPGYLKMGWELAGKLPVSISIGRPLSMLAKMMGKIKAPEPQNEDINYYLQHPDLPALIDDTKGQCDTIVTNASVAYLKWRYLDVPVAHYLAIGEEQGSKLSGLILGRIKDTRYGRELRITDCFINKEANTKELMRKLSSRKKEWGVDYTTVTGLCRTGKKINSGLCIITKGPNVTIRSLSMEVLDPLRNFNQWSPSLGDLELF